MSLGGMSHGGMSHGGMSHAGRLVVNASPLGMIKRGQTKKKRRESRHTYAVAALSTGWSAKTEPRIFRIKS